MAEVVQFLRKLRKNPFPPAHSPFSIRVTQHDGLWYVAGRKNCGFCFASYREALHEAGELADGWGVGTVVEMGALQ